MLDQEAACESRDAAMPSLAYKLKKPVRNAFVDFTTLAAREHDCLMEVALTGDHCAPALFSFYKSVSACVRAQLAIWHADDRDIADPAPWRERANHYLALAQQHARTTSG